jgi:putative DNA primase/helicase
VLRTIQLKSGELSRAATEAEQALIASEAKVFARAGDLVCPIPQTVGAASGQTTVSVRFKAFTRYSLLSPLTDAAIFQRYDARRRRWVDVDPPWDLINVVLANEHRWAFPRVAGVITTPTLRPDGSLLAAPGYDPRTELYLWPTVQLPSIPAAPTREEAKAALALLKTLFGEFSFRDEKVDLANTLSGVLTTLLRGSLPTAPIYLVRADTPGVGKSYLVDVVSTIATGRICPVVPTSSNPEETEKQLGAILLDGSQVVSLDNLTHDLGGKLMCQIGERPIVRVRVLGRSEMPDCEVHTAIWGTGNNVSYFGDMTRRGFVINIKALSERPELREFQGDALKRAREGRADFVAAALTIVRAYLAAGSPKVCGPFGSYGAWTAMVRGPLVWLDEPDPVDSMEEVRKEDSDLSDREEFFALWTTYLLLDHDYILARLTEVACGKDQKGDLNAPDFREFLLRVAATRGNQHEVSLLRLSKWLKRISGRIVNGYRLVMEKDSHMKTIVYRLTKI